MSPNAEANRRSLTPEQNERVKKALEAVVTRFKGKRSHAAKAIGISHTAITEILGTETSGPTRFVGMNIVKRLADYLDQDPSDLIDGTRKRTSLPMTALGTFDEWEDLRAETAARYAGKIDHEILDDVARMSFARRPDNLTVEDIKRLHDVLADLYSRNPRAKEAARR